jgi:hypothetical protein
MNLPCVEIPALPDPQQLTLPGGVQIEHLNLMQIVQPALTPLVPLFDLVDAIVAVFNCVKAIPDALGPPPDPTVLAACLPELAKKVDKLLRLIPQLSLPIMIVQLVDLVIDTVRQARSQLLHLQQQAKQVVRVVARATELDDAGLMAISQCARANLAQEAANVGKSLAAIGKLIGLINLFLGMLGGPQVPDAAQLSGKPLDGAVAALDELLATLTTIRGALPVP